MFEETKKLCINIHGLMRSGTISGFYSARADTVEQEIKEAEELIENLNESLFVIIGKINELHSNSFKRFAVLRELIEFCDKCLNEKSIDIIGKEKKTE